MVDVKQHVDFCFIHCKELEWVEALSLNQVDGNVDENVDALKYATPVKFFV